jgi:AcrR family transcriptional regulator
MNRRRLTRSESAAVTRRRLLEAAQDLFLERGFHGASLEAVAERAGFTKGAVYSRFASKGDLFVELLDARRVQTISGFEAVAAEAQTSSDLARAVSRWWTQRLAEGPAWQLALIEFWTSAGRDPALLERFRQAHTALFAGVSAVLEQAAERLDVELPAPSIDIVRATTALGHGLALELVVDPGALDEHAMARAFEALTSAGGLDVLAQAHRIATEGE